AIIPCCRCTKTDSVRTFSYREKVCHTSEVWHTFSIDMPYLRKYGMSSLRKYGMSYSVLNDFTGLDIPAFTACKPILRNPIMTARAPASRNIHQPIWMR